jgi:hypothetical protein
MLMPAMLLVILLAPRDPLALQQGTPALPQILEVLKVMEIDSTGADLRDLGQAIDLARGDDALLYLRAGLKRLDLRTGRAETLVPNDALGNAGVTGEPNTLLTTADANRIIVMTGGTWNCPWSIFLISISPFSARRLTETACGKVDLSPSTENLAVVTSSACEGRACGERRLLILSTRTGVAVFQGTMPENYSELYWDDDRVLTIRYDEDPEPSSPRPARHWALSLAESRAGWAWRKPEPATMRHVTDVDVDDTALVKLRLAGQAAVSFRADAVFGDPPAGYRADAPRVFHRNERLVVLRRLWQKEPELGAHARRREQVALIRVKSAT